MGKEIVRKCSPLAPYSLRKNLKRKRMDCIDASEFSQTSLTNWLHPIQSNDLSASNSHTRISLHEGATKHALMGISKWGCQETPIKRYICMRVPRYTHRKVSLDEGATKHALMGISAWRYNETHAGTCLSMRAPRNWHIRVRLDEGVKKHAHKGVFRWRWLKSNTQWSL
jgi:hypothetical protein